MITPIQTPEGEKTLLLGYEVIRFMAKPPKEDTTEFDQIEEAALVGFNTWAKRHNEAPITKDQMIAWFDDMNVYITVINAVKDFMENFTKRVSGNDQTSEEKPKGKK